MSLINVLITWKVVYFLYKLNIKFAEELISHLEYLEDEAIFIMREVAEYNQNIVHKVYEDNQKLMTRNKELEDSLAVSLGINRKISEEQGQVLLNSQ